ncbi:MAG: ornithine cyclodeaminase family protein [Pseudomonadota bacterium]
MPDIKLLNLMRPEIEALIDHDQAAKAIENAYRALSRGAVNNPAVGHIVFPEEDGDCHIKYGHIRGDAVFVIKIATGFPRNARFGLPNGNGLSVVLSAVTGEVRAVLHDEMKLTDIRTGLGGAIASRLLSRRNSRRVVIVGTGIQSRQQIEAHATLLGADLEFLVWGRSREAAARVVEECADHATIGVSDDLETACRLADIVVTTTGAKSPLIRRAWIRRGTHITAVGADAPGKQELSNDLVAASDRLVADLASQSLDHGEFSTPAKAGLIDPERLVELGAILNGSAEGRTTEEQITIADLTGVAAQDIAMARLVIEAASGQG